MLFNSFEFFIFLPIVFCLYWFVFNRSLRLQNTLLLAAGYFFYGWWSYKFLCLLVLSTVLDFSYGFGVALINRKKAKFFLWLSIINNLGILGVLKYYNFFATQFQQGFDALGIHISPVLLHFALPVGISFYTFHGMSYVFDIYRGKQKPIANFIEYGLFVNFFPLLVAGPIERARHLLPQIQQKHTFNYKQATEGARLIIWGLFKKVVIADGLAAIVNDIFGNYHDKNGITLIIGAIAFSFQIYGDFSGYSDIAMGSAKLFGFEVFSNFRFPYFSRDVAEFWRRWHISLSSWFRDYLYIPLGGSKAGKVRATRNVFIIFLVSGFWHGASWNFIAWGAIHACGFLPLLLLNRNREHVSDVVAQGRKLPGKKELLQMLTTFSFITIAWIFFRAKDMATALDYLKRICISTFDNPSQYLDLPVSWPVFLYIIPLICCDWSLRYDERRLNFGTPMVETIISWMLIFAIIFSFQRETTFIYSQF